jgi:hypothetical protein
MGEIRYQNAVVNISSIASCGNFTVTSDLRSPQPFVLGRMKELRRIPAH